MSLRLYAPFFSNHSAASRPGASMDSEAEHFLPRARSLVDKFNQRGDISHIDGAIDLGREALKLCPPGHPKRSISLTQLAVSLSDRYSRLGELRDLEDAIVFNKEALTLHSQGHLQRLVPLNNLANHLADRYDQFGAMQDLDEAIVLNREALELCPQGCIQRCILSNNLLVRLITRHEQLGAMQDLNEAIALGTEALGLFPQEHPQRFGFLDNLANCLLDRYKQIGSMQDLEMAIVLTREALDLCPQGHPRRSGSLNNLAVRLSTRYDQLGIMQDLDEAIVLSREAVNLCPQGHPQRSIFLNSLANHLSDRYDKFGSMQDLDETIVLGREALNLCLPGHSLRSHSLNNLASRLFTRRKRLGKMQDMDEAIILCREALNLRPYGHPQRSSCLNNLSNFLSDRYDQFGAMQDLNEAIVLGQEALGLRPQGHPLRPSSLNNLSNHLLSRYQQLREIQDLDGAIVLVREALDLCPQGHPQRSSALNNLSVHLATRHKQLRMMQDLDEAIVLAREALDLCPSGHPSRFSSLTNLSIHLCARHVQLGAMQDLDEAIDLGREALNLLPQGYPSRSQSLDNLAHYFFNRFIASGRVEDKEEVFGLFAQLVHMDRFVSSRDLPAARTWIRMAEDFQHPSLLLAYETSLQLLTRHLATLPSLPQHHSIFKKLASSLAVDAFSACLRNHDPKRAVELLEQGRGVYWSQLTRLHSSLDEVRKYGPAGEKLADAFKHLAERIRDALNPPSADQHERVLRLNFEMQTVVASIRELPALSRFLLPPLFSDLQSAASGGPVVLVNASKYSCDALIVLPSRDPVHIPLQITQKNARDLSTELHTLTVHAKKVDVTRELASLLRKLWDGIVSPIIDCLQMTLPLQSRIWWCPTAEFSGLPLHAAGPYRRGQRNLPDLYISSYTPTLTALIRVRRHELSNSVNTRKRFIAIGQATTAGETELLSVAAELDNVSQRVDELAAFTRIDGEAACISRVVEELGKNEWVHLACHGIPSSKQPFESAFALHDGHFTIQRIIGCNSKNSEFAYLSACHTIVGDKESPDEAIHLASAMQFIGYRSVIGTMWAVDDGETTKITSTFYEHMVGESGRLDHTRAAFALNRTMRSVDIPLDQRILYIHLGA